MRPWLIKQIKNEKGAAYFMFREESIMKGMSILLLLATCFFMVVPLYGSDEQQVSKLRDEVKNKGWLLYSAKSLNGTWDIFLSRPDGSQSRNITNTADFEEAAPHFFNDGKKIIYRQAAKGTIFQPARYGFQGRLVIADSNGANPTIIGEEGQYTWAVISEDGKFVCCITPKEVQIIDLSTKEKVRGFPRQSVFWLGGWSLDGKWVCGVTNSEGLWTIVRINVESGEQNIVHQFQNCTPDWFPDSKYIIYSSRPAGQTGAKGYGYTQLWMSEGEGRDHRLIYGEDGLHVYGGSVSPDGQYILFTKGGNEGGGAKESGATICIMRLADAPTITGESIELRKVHPDTKDGTILELEPGWEPSWTYSEIIE